MEDQLCQVFCIHLFNAHKTLRGGWHSSRFADEQMNTGPRTHCLPLGMPSMQGGSPSVPLSSSALCVLWLTLARAVTPVPAPIGPSRFPCSQLYRAPVHPASTALTRLPGPGRGAQALQKHKPLSFPARPPSSLSEPNRVGFPPGPGAWLLQVQGCLLLLAARCVLLQMLPWMAAVLCLNSSSPPLCSLGRETSAFPRPVNTEATHAAGPPQPINLGPRVLLKRQHEGQKAGWAPR